MTAALDLFKATAGIRRRPIGPEMRECAPLLLTATLGGSPEQYAIALAAVAMRLSAALSPADVADAPISVAAECVGPGDAEVVAREVMQILVDGLGNLSAKEAALSCIALAAALADAMGLTELLRAGLAEDEPPPARARAPVPRPAAASRQARRLADRQARRGVK